MSDPKVGTGKKPKGSGRRLYTDENPKDTVSVEFSSAAAIKKTLAKASFKSKSHKRQSQIINLIHQRVRAAYQNAKDPKVKARLKKALNYAEERKEASKRKTKRMQKSKKDENVIRDRIVQEVLSALEEQNENLRDWFGKSKSKGKDGKPGWVQAGGKYDGKPCARQPGQKTTPKCVSRSKYDSMSKKERDNAARRKRKKDPGQPKKTGAAKPTYVKTDPQKGGRKKKKNEGLKLDRQRLVEIIQEELQETLYYQMLTEGETLEEAEYQGRKVTLNKPFRTPDGPKKSSVYVKNAKGNVVKVNFGDPKMKIKKNIPARRKSFRARHNCDNPGPKWKARYWSCKAW
jgi:hypothetical protein|tara:strand:+ start:968 stop:2002 length:1035 start_codon:yes stop_codon:yes gene_type:complete